MGGRPAAVLLFGESGNDREAIAELVRALRPDCPRVEKRQKPLVLVKGQEQARARRNLVDITKVVRATAHRFDVKLVIAHEDCDEVEPAHLPLSEQIEQGLAAQGVPTVAATPAWEIEAWWFLWPDAVVGVNSRWRRPARTGQRVGLVPNAKEALRRDLRPKTGGKRPRDYEESDSPKIAAKVRELGLIDRPEAISDSFDRFADAVRAAAM